MENITLIIIIILEAIMVLSIVFYFVKYKRLITKKEYLFFFPLFFIFFTLNFLAYNAVTGATGVLVVLKCIGLAFKNFALDFKDEYVSVLFASSLAYRIAFIIANALAGYTMISVIAGFFFTKAINRARVASKIRKGSDILIGYSEVNVAYAKQRNLSILWLDQAIDQEKLDYLGHLGISYINAPFTSENIISYTVPIFSKKENHFIIFLDHPDRLRILAAFKHYLELSADGDKHLLKRARLAEMNNFLHYEAERDNLFSIRDCLELEDALKSHIVFFNYFELLARDFQLKYPLSSLLNTTDLDIKTGALRSKTEIRVIFIGFGDTNEELFRASIANNQFVKLDADGQPKAAPIQYFVFDKNETLRHNKTLTYFLQYPSAETALPATFFPAPETTHHLTFVPASEANVYSAQGCHRLLEIASAPGAHSFFFISIGNDFDNMDYGTKLMTMLKHYPFIRANCFIRSKNEEMLSLFSLNDTEFLFYGYRSSVLNHGTLVNERLSMIAQSQNESYNRSSELLKRERLLFYSLSPIKQYSNIYSAINRRFKLNLIGLDWHEIKGQGSGLNQGAYNEIYGADRSRTMSAYDPQGNKTPTLRKILAYQEHLRWCAFYLANGFKQMPKAELSVSYDFINQRWTVHDKDEKNGKTHICLTSYVGLAEVTQSVYQLMKDACPSTVPLDSIKPYDYYQYDFDAMDDIVETSLKTGMEIILKR